MFAGTRDACLFAPRFLVLSLKLTVRNAPERIAAGHPMLRIHELLPWIFGADAVDR